MKNLMFLLILFFSSTPSYAQYNNFNNRYVNSYNFAPQRTIQPQPYINPYANPSQINVNGYLRSNGTYVQPYIRTAPNNIQYDNLRYRAPRY